MDRSARDRKPRSWTARILAPLLLVVVVGAVVIIVSGSLGGDDSSKKSDSKATTTTSDCKPSAPDAVKAGYYVVTADDTAGLSGIADKTCIPVDELIKLNPNLDPQTLQVSNCVDLVKDGCKALASG
jgi:LysM repeat protein